MSSEYSIAATEIYEMADRIVYAHLPELLKVWDPQTVANNESKIGIIFRDKASKSAGRPVYGKVAKVSPRMKPMSAYPHVDYMIELAHDMWMSLNLHQQEALLFHHLSQFKIEEDAENGTLKVRLVKPEIQYFFRELDIYGDWRPREVEESGEGGAIPREQDPDNVERALGVRTNAE